MTSIVEPLVRWIIRRYPLPIRLSGASCHFVESKYRVCGMPSYHVVAKRGDVTVGQIEWSNQGHFYVLNLAPRMNVTREMVVDIYAMMKQLAVGTGTLDARRAVSSATVAVINRILGGKQV